MPYSIWKKLCWSVFYLSAGPWTLSLLTIVKCIMRKIDVECLTCLAVTSPIVILSIGTLVTLYRKEPSLLHGTWHLRFGELIAISLLIGFGFTGGQFLSREEVIYNLIPITFTAGFALAGGLLGASRHGYWQGLERYLFGLGFALRTFGYLAIGGCLVRRFADQFTRCWQETVIDFGIAALVLGISLCGIVEKWALPVTKENRQAGDFQI
jgi:hypothetical protein